MSGKKITKDMTIGEVISSNPKAADILTKAGFGCVTCPMAAMETLEQGAVSHGMDKKELDALLKELNK